MVSAATGEVVAQQRYLPFGSVRWRTHTPLPTDRQYTGQRWDDALGLYDYKARYYDPALGRFIQPDTIVPEPGDPQALNRYSYVLNNPLRYNDPSGHRLSECGLEGSECVGGGSPSSYSEGELPLPPNDLPETQKITVGVMVPQEIAPPSVESNPNEPSVPIVEFFQLLFDFPYWGLKDQANRRHFAQSSTLPPNVYLTLTFSYNARRFNVSSVNFFL